MSRLFLLISLILCTGLQARTDTTFLQMQTWMRSLTANEWQREVRAMYRAGLRTLIWQWNRYDAEDFSATADLIVAAAKRQHMHVYFGLPFEQDWWHRWSEIAYLQFYAAREAEAVRAMAQRYGTSEVFAGWYLPMEVGDWTMTDAQQAQLNVFFHEIAAACLAATPGKTVLASAFFAGKQTPVDFARVQKTIWQNNSVHALLVQDGVGERDWGPHWKTRVLPYYAALTPPLKKVGIAVWPTLECFQRRGDSRLSASKQFVRDQESAFSDRYPRNVLFDYFHYLSPFRTARKHPPPPPANSGV